MAVSIENEKAILTYILNHEDYNDYANIYNLFENDKIKELFNIIKDTKSTDTLIIQNKFLDANKNVSLKDLGFLSKNGVNDEWLAQVFFPWKREKLVKNRIHEITTLYRNEEYDKLLDEFKLDIYNDIDVEIGEKLDIENTPLIDSNVYSTLPPILSDIFKVVSRERERDVIFTSAIPVLSVLFPNVSTVWDSRIDRPNLYSFIAAPAGSGKGNMLFSKYLLYEYSENEKLCNENRKYQIDQINSIKEKGSPKEEYIQKVTNIPANSSSAAFFLKINNNDGIGLIHTTEADDIIGGKRSEWGNYDNMFRLGFHNEDIGRNRVDEDIMYIENPYICSSVAGTYDQLINMFDGKSENGLFSRFIFYIFSGKEKWIRRGDIEEIDLIGQMKEHSKKINNVYNYYKDLEVKININKKMSDYMDDTFEFLKRKYLTVYDEEFGSVVNRIAVISRKILMIFTMFRMYNSEEDCFYDMNEENLDDIHLLGSVSTPPGKLLLEAVEIDVYNAVSLAKTYLEHASIVFNSFSYNNTNKKPVIIKQDKTENVFELLDTEFQYSEAVSMGDHYDISKSTITRYIKKGLLNGSITKLERGKYRQIKKEKKTFSDDN